MVIEYDPKKWQKCFSELEETRRNIKDIEKIVGVPIKQVRNKIDKMLREMEQWKKEIKFYKEVLNK